MNKLIKTGFAALSAVALLASAPAYAQEAASSSSSSMTDEDVGNIALVCVATYDYVLAKGQGGDKTAEITTARGLARDIYQAVSKGDDAKVDNDIALIDKALADEVAAGTTKIDDFRSTCDMLLIEKPAA